MREPRTRPPRSRVYVEIPSYPRRDLLRSSIREPQMPRMDGADNVALLMESTASLSKQDLGESQVQAESGLPESAPGFEPVTASETNGTPSAHHLASPSTLPPAFSPSFSATRAKRPVSAKRTYKIQRVDAGWMRELGFEPVLGTRYFR
jgi:hypothetical protein